MTQFVRRHYVVTNGCGRSSHTKRELVYEADILFIAYHLKELQYRKKFIQLLSQHTRSIKRNLLTSLIGWEKWVCRHKILFSKL